MTKVINLIGGPGVGKSTLAAQLYADMKKTGYKVELVREVAKEWAWEEREINAFDQISIVGEQIRRESSLFGKVDYIITDSPVLLGAFYLQYNHNALFMNSMVKSYYDYGTLHNVRFLNFLLPRDKEYQSSGRYETEKDAKLLDEYLVMYLQKYNYNFQRTNDSHSEILDKV